MFTQLPYRDKAVEPENRLWRTILDYSLYDLTGLKDEERFEIYEWLDLNNPDFIECCFYSSLDPEKTYNMYLYFLKNFFKDIWQEYSCYKYPNGVQLTLSE